jgi:hypothetical protein
MNQIEVIQPPSTTKIGLTFGAYLALLNIAFFIIQLLVVENPFTGDWKRWLILVASIVMVMFAHRKFKSINGGFMSFGQGVTIALIAMLLSILISFIVRYSYTYFIDESLMQEVWDMAYEIGIKNGQSEETIQESIRLGENLFWPILLISSTVLSFISSLIISLFTQRKKPEYTL